MPELSRDMMQPRHLLMKWKYIHTYIHTYIHINVIQVT